MSNRNISNIYTTYKSRRTNKNVVDKTKIPEHLRHLSDRRLKALFYLFRGVM